MTISELKAGQGNVTVEGEITEVTPTRTFEKFGKTGRVANAVLKDDTGQVKISLWNDQVDQIKSEKIRAKQSLSGHLKGEKTIFEGDLKKQDISAEQDGEFSEDESGTAEEKE